MKGIILNDDLTLKISNGSLVIGDTTYQNQKILLLAEKGEFKSRPMRGVGTKRFLESAQPDELAREIRTEFFADGMTVNSIKIPQNGQLSIDAVYDN
jgi:hypothetical protein